MSFATTWQAWRDARDRWPNGWALWHWRYATGGGIRRDMAHPFRWGADGRIVIGHNGVLPVPSTATASDTARFAERCGDLPPAMLDDPRFMADLAGWATGSKLAMLSAHPETRDAVYIVNEDAGHWVGGVWYSNRSYEPYRPPARLWTPGNYSPALWGAQTPTRDNGDPFDLMGCAMCGDDYPVPVDDLAAYCPTCDSCWCCDEVRGECECWEPAPAYVHPDYRHAVDAWDTGAAYN
jgi:glutamine amidotransferase